MNTKCKYINLRIDMRDGHCLIFDKDNNPIELEDLLFQYRDLSHNNDHTATADKQPTPKVTT